MPRQKVQRGKKRDKARTSFLRATSDQEDEDRQRKDVQVLKKPSQRDMVREKEGEQIFRPLYPEAWAQNFLASPEEAGEVK